MNLSEKLLLDASEFLNAVYEDTSQINEILTLQDPTLLLSGAALFYQGLSLSNSLPSKYLTAVLSLANYYDLFEKTAETSEQILDYFYAFDDTRDLHACDVSAEVSDEADDEHMQRVVEVKMQQNADAPVPEQTAAISE